MGKSWQRNQVKFASVEGAGSGPAFLLNANNENDIVVVFVLNFCRDSRDMLQAKRAVLPKGTVAEHGDILSLEKSAGNKKLKIGLLAAKIESTLDAGLIEKNLRAILAVGFTN